MSDEIYYLYHIRDRENSAGFGHDGYVGITNDLHRRAKEHFGKLAKGTHSNRLMQEAYKTNGKNLEVYVVAQGTKADMEARERAIVYREGHHWNSQIGGGPRRGMSRIDAVKLSRDEQLKASTALKKRKTGTIRKAPGRADVGGKAVAGVGPGAAALEIAAGAAVASAAFVSGLGAAHVIGKTVLKDDERHHVDERQARKIGRFAGYAGGAGGAAGIVTTVCVAGEIGLAGSALTAGLTAVGTTVGGGVAVVVLVPALAATACAAVGYFGYKQIQRYRNRKLSPR